MFIPPPEHPGESIIEFELTNIRHLDQLFKDNYLDKVAHELFDERDRVQNLLCLWNYPDDIRNRFKFAISLIQSKDYREARKQLEILVTKYEVIDAKVVLGILLAERTELLENLKAYQFMHYLKWRQETPPGTSVTMIVEFDGGREFVLPEYDERGVSIADQQFEKFRIKFKLNSDGSATPIVYVNEMKLMCGLLDQDGNILYEFGQVIVDSPPTI